MVVTGALIAAALTLTGCASSAPARLGSPSSAASPSPTEPLLTEQAGSGTSVGALVKGFPTQLVPVPDGATVLVSSAQPIDGGLTQISLNLRSAQDAAGLLAAVRGPLLAAGFHEAPPAQPDPGLAAQSSFSRSDGTELVLVGVLDRDGVRTLTLGGRVHV
ncbi:MAG: hypothetical protein BGO38_08355 [Cellulomonas sp. 73-145]|nr:hypothetical protein [Cellulomonas sp.]OJV58347.1 MAG: hypothetical protein BGO38_08355 [Cellulomonas sp. 73-145]